VTSLVNEKSRSWADQGKQEREEKLHRLTLLEARGREMGLQVQKAPPKDAIWTSSDISPEISRRRERVGRTSLDHIRQAKGGGATKRVVRQFVRPALTRGDVKIGGRAF